MHDGHEVDGVSWWHSVPELSLERGYRDLTAIDLSTTALQVVRDRLDPAGDAVVLEMADVLDLNPPVATRSGTTARSTTSSPNPTSARTTWPRWNAPWSRAGTRWWPPSDPTVPRPAAACPSSGTPTTSWPRSSPTTSCWAPRATTMRLPGAAPSSSPPSTSAGPGDAGDGRRDAHGDEPPRSPWPNPRRLTDDRTERAPQGADSTLNIR